MIVCGHNDELKEQVKALVARRDDFRVVGFTKEMPQLMRMPSLFVGKTGGLSSSECIDPGAVADQAEGPASAAEYFALASTWIGLMGEAERLVLGVR